MRLGLFLAALLVIAPAMALSVNIGSDQTNLTLNDNLSINYLIELNQPTEINYTIGLLSSIDNITVYSNGGLTSYLSDSFDYNITNIEAGNYTLYLQVKSDLMDILEFKPEKIIINPVSDYSLNVFSKIYLINETAQGMIIVHNAGNTKLSVTAYFLKAQSELNIYPQSFLLTPNETKSLLVIAGKPLSDYNASLNFVLANDFYQSTSNYSVSVIIPVINLSLDNVAQAQANLTTVFANVTNKGNMEVNASISFRTFTITQGFNVYTFDVNLPVGETTQLVYNLPLSSVVSATLTYEGLNGTVQLKHELSPVDQIPFSFTQDQMLLIMVIGLAVVVYVYLKFFKKKKFR